MVHGNFLCGRVWQAGDKHVSQHQVQAFLLRQAQESLVVRTFGSS